MLLHSINVLYIRIFEKESYISDKKMRIFLQDNDLMIKKSKQKKTLNM